MWLMTDIGFFSVVQKPGDELLTVRARSAEDLDRLRQAHLPSLAATVTGGGTDYPFRATASREAVAEAAASVTRAITYANFKTRVAATMGSPRAHTYGRVWSDLLEIERETAEATE